MVAGMELRTASVADLDRISEIDGTIESSRYLHLERGGEGINGRWRLDERPLRTKLVDPNTLNDERRFSVRQVLAGVEDGFAIAAEHEGELAALAVGQIDLSMNVLRIVEARVDYDHRRQGIGSAMLYQLIGHARERELRAVTTHTLTNNVPGNEFFAKAGFELTGFDTHLRTNHDLVKEAVTLFWYLPLIERPM